MLKIKCIIENVEEFQIGDLPSKAERIETPQTMDDLMKKSWYIIAVLCVILNLCMFAKIFLSRISVAAPVFILIGFMIGFILLGVHELLHAIVYPKEATVTIGKLKGKMVFVALASYPMKRSRFIVMCLLPFVLGIVPLTIFLLSPAESIILNGLMFGMACIGMVSPSVDVFNVIAVLKNSKKTDNIMFYKDDIYKVN